MGWVSVGWGHALSMIIDISRACLIYVFPCTITMLINWAKLGGPGPPGPPYSYSTEWHNFEKDTIEGIWIRNSVKEGQVYYSRKANGTDPREATPEASRDERDETDVWGLNANH